MKNLIDSRSYPLSVSIRAAGIYILIVALIFIGIQGLDRFDITYGALLIFLYFLETILVHYQQRLFHTWWGAFITKEYHHWSTRWLLSITGTLLLIIETYSLFVFIQPETFGAGVLLIIISWVILESIARNIGSKLASIRYTDRSTYPNYQHSYIG